MNAANLGIRALALGLVLCACLFVSLFVHQQYNPKKTTFIGFIYITWQTYVVLYRLYVFEVNRFFSLSVQEMCMNLLSEAKVT